MNLTSKIDLKLFYPKAINEKVHYTVRWKKLEDIFQGMRFIEYGKEELRESGPFITRAGADGFVNDLLTHIPSFTGWYEIIEHK